MAADDVLVEKTKISAHDSEDDVVLVNNDGALSDEELLRRADDYFSEDRLLAAARVLGSVKDSSLYQDRHVNILEHARICESFMMRLKSPVSLPTSNNNVEDEHEKEVTIHWKKVCESHVGNFDTIIYLKADPETNTKLTARIETPIEKSLLVPLLSVLNETELYTTWLPSWTTPFRIGLDKADKLQQTGRCSQILRLKTMVPWPIGPRFAIISATGFDDIDEGGDICIKINSLKEGEPSFNDIVLSREAVNGEAKMTTLDFDGGFLFSKCPNNHPALPFISSSTSEKTMSRKKETRKPLNIATRSTSFNGVKEKDNLILVRFSLFVDANCEFLPRGVVNFVAKTVIGRMWNMFLKVAEEVRDGKRRDHSRAIARKRKQIYDWVDNRVQAMFEMLVHDSS